MNRDLDFEHFATIPEWQTILAELQEEINLSKDRCVYAKTMEEKEYHRGIVETLENVRQIPEAMARKQEAATSEKTARGEEGGGWERCLPGQHNPYVGRG